ncbi:MAG: arsinothricin resistance N-acetyltransferase ArsN1 family A [Planctomycetota bacterium]
MTTRAAVASDAAVITAIYNEGIEDRVATFETEPRTEEQVRAMLDDAKRYPIIVCEREGDVMAWARVSKYRDRACYDGVGEASVYVARAGRGNGAGTAVLEALCAAAEAKGYWKLVSRIFETNKASRALCKRVGFTEVGIYRRHAKLDGEWKDCVIVEKLLVEAAKP